MSKNNNYITGDLLDYLYYQNYFKLIGVDLSRKTNVGKLGKDDGATIFLNFSLDSLIVTE